MNVGFLIRKWSVISIVLAVILLVSTTFWFGVTPKATLVEISNLSSTPDFFLKGVHSSVFDENGKISEEIEAKELKHFPSNNEVSLVFPKVTSYQPQSKWEVSGDFGKISEDENLVRFTDNAQAIKDKNTEDQVVIAADVIEYFDNDQKILGTDNTSITSTNELITADTFTALIKQNTMEIKGSVRGIYEKP